MGRNLGKFRETNYEEKAKFELDIKGGIGLARRRSNRI